LIKSRKQVSVDDDDYENIFVTSENFYVFSEERCVIVYKNINIFKNTCECSLLMTIFIIVRVDNVKKMC
jgi:hypothetical protein